MITTGSGLSGPESWLQIPVVFAVRHNTVCIHAMCSPGAHLIKGGGYIVPAFNSTAGITDMLFNQIVYNAKTTLVGVVPRHNWDAGTARRHRERRTHVPRCRRGRVQHGMGGEPTSMVLAIDNIHMVPTSHHVWTDANQREEIF
jgi:hypothetical protein